MASAPRFVGSEVKRLEDPRLIQGQAQYVDDFTLPGLLHAAVLRSPHAHARIASLDVAPAAHEPGVVALLTWRELEGKVGQKSLGFAPPGIKNPERLPLAKDEVRFVGHPVALVLATERALARDAADLIRVEYEPLPAVIDPETAAKAGAPNVYRDLPDNVAFEHKWQVGELEAAFARADRIVRGRFVNPIVSCLLRSLGSLERTPSRACQASRFQVTPPLAGSFPPTGEPDGARRVDRFETPQTTTKLTPCTRSCTSVEWVTDRSW